MELPVDSCWTTTGPDWLLTSVLAGVPAGLLFLGIWWDVRRRPTDPAADLLRHRRRSDGDEIENGHGERVVGKWMTVYIAMLLGIPVVFLFVNRSVGQSLAGLASFGFLVVVVLGWASGGRRTARVTRLILVGLGIGCLTAGSAALPAIARAC